MMRPVNLIVIHCSATRQDCAYTVADLERDHVARGFVRAGYHFYIRRSGDIFPLRPLDMVPAHVTGYNRHSVGICYEGGLSSEGIPSDTRTEEQKRMLKLLLVQLISRYPGSRICGHRDLSPDRNGDGTITPDEWIKRCPCFDAEKEYGALRAN